MFRSGYHVSLQGQIKAILKIGNKRERRAFFMREPVLTYSAMLGMSFFVCQFDIEMFH